MRVSTVTILGLLISRPFFGLVFLANAGDQFNDDFNTGSHNGWTRLDPLAQFGAPATFSFPTAATGSKPPLHPIQPLLVQHAREVLDQT